jgi:hypothetical protein
VAGREDQPQPVVGQLVGLGELLLVGAAQRLECLELGTLGVKGALAAQPIDRPIAGDARDPGAGVVGDAVARPALERDGERVLDGLLGGVEVAEDADQGRDRPPGLLPEGAIDDPCIRYEETSAVRFGRSKPNCV